MPEPVKPTTTQQMPSEDDSIQAMFDRLQEQSHGDVTPQPPSEEPAVGPEKVVETPDVEEEPETETEPEEFDDRELVDPRASQFEMLQEQLRQTQQQLVEMQQATRESKKPELKVMPFVTNEEYEAALSSPDAMNALLSRVYHAAVQHTMGTVPAQVRAQVSQVATMERTVEDYFRKNPELIPHREYMGVIATNLEAENPGLSPSAIIERSAQEVRKRVGLKQRQRDTGKVPVDKARKPAFATPTGARRPNPNSTKPSWDF